MNMVARKRSLLAVGLLLVCGGIGMGALASSLANDSIKWRRPAIYPATDPVLALAGIDQAAAGQGWARSAFPGGLRRCPEMNARFVAACEAEIKALLEQPAALAGGYGGPLLITTVEPGAPEPEIDAVVEPSSVIEERPAHAIGDARAVAEPKPDNYPAMSPTTEPAAAAEQLD